MNRTSTNQRRRLDADRAALVVQISGLQAAFADIVASSELVATDDEHDPEGHTIAFERQQIAALLREANAQLAALDDAMERLDDGTYGTCTRCGGHIGTERLEALPAATVCIVCAA